MAVNPAPAPDDPGPVEPVGPKLAAAIRAELADERARGESIQSRALTLAAGAAAATALIFGLGTDYAGRWQPWFFSLLLVAGLLFIAAMGMAWWSVRLVSVEQPDLDEFQRLVDEEGDPEIDDLELYISTALMTTLKDARDKNTKRGEWLGAALKTFLLGAVAVGCELVIVVSDKVLT